MGQETEPANLGEALQRLRLARGLRRADLAAPERQLSEKSLEAYEAGRRRPSLDSLDVLADRLHAPFHRLADLAVAATPAELQRVLDSLLMSPDASRSGPSTRQPPSHPGEACETSELITQTDALGIAGRWFEAEQAAYAALTLTSNLHDRSTIAVRDCALMAQQAGNVRRARQYMEQVRRDYAELGEAIPDDVQALLDNREGWIAVEQEGRYRPAIERFTKAATLAREVGDPALLNGALHFRARAVSEIAMTEAGGWLSARPSSGTSLRADRIAELKYVLETDWAAYAAFDPENPYHYLRRFEIEALIEPSKALRNLEDTRSLFSGREHLLALSRARWSLNDNPAAARELSQVALNGYLAMHYPAGAALAAAVHGEAVFQCGLRTDADWTDCLDSWVLGLLFHPYARHSLFPIMVGRLRETARRIESATRGPSFLVSYWRDLNYRAGDGVGQLSALHRVEIATFPIPEPYIRGLLSATGGQELTRERR